MRQGLLLFFLLSLLLIPAQPTAAQDFAPIPCPDDLPLECNILTVPENHADPNGKSIHLMFGIARAKNPSAPPLLFLAGGPGSSGLAAYRDGSFERAILQTRDIIYLDQRGTGHSSPNLACPEMNQSRLLDAATRAARLGACRDRLLAAGVELTAYTTAQNAADVVMLRKALGYEKIGLWGVSYGTRLALAVMRLDATGVEAAILDSALPPNAPIENVSPATLDRLFQQCADDFLCNLAYPDLKTIFDELVARLNQTPVSINVGAQHFRMNGDLLRLGMGELMSDPAVFAYLPSLIDDFQRGDFSRLQGILLGLNDDMNQGLAFSVLCTEAAPFTQNTAALPDAAALCQHWFTAPPDPALKMPVFSEVPTLILAGELDALTPPHYGQLTAESLSHATYVEFSGLGHGVMGNACAQQIALNFLNNPAQPPDTHCKADLSSVSFVIGIAPTRPFATATTGLLTLTALMGIGAVVWRVSPMGWYAVRRLMGWLPQLITLGVLVLLFALADYTRADMLRLVEIIVSLAVAVQVILITAPDGDESLEMLLACPRPGRWLIIERFLMVFATHGLIAIGASGVAIWQFNPDSIPLTLISWLPPTVLLTGIGLYTTFRTRHTLFALSITLVVWFGLVFMKDALLPGQIVIEPLNYLQVGLWVIQPYLTPDDLSHSDYLLNRVMVTAAGINLFLLALWQFRNEEHLLK